MVAVDASMQRPPSHHDELARAKDANESKRVVLQQDTNSCWMEGCKKFYFHSDLFFAVMICLVCDLVQSKRQ